LTCIFAPFAASGFAAGAGSGVLGAPFDGVGLLGVDPFVCCGKGVDAVWFCLVSVVVGG
jgi:hypothetical protein